MQQVVTTSTIEAPTEISELLDRVERGEQIALTRRGVHVATIVPVAIDAEKTRRAVEGLRELREKLRSEGKGFSLEDILSARDEGRK